MDKFDYQKKAKRLLILLIILFIPLYIYSGFQRFSVPNNQELWDWHGIAAYALILVVFYPVLHRINKYAQLGEMNQLYKLSKLLILMIRSILILAPFAFVLTYIMF